MKRRRSWNVWAIGAVEHTILFHCTSRWRLSRTWNPSYLPSLLRNAVARCPNIINVMWARSYPSLTALGLRNAVNKPPKLSSSLLPPPSFFPPPVDSLRLEILWTKFPRTDNYPTPKLCKNLKFAHFQFPKTTPTAGKSNSNIQAQLLLFQKIIYQTPAAWQAC